MAKCLSAPSLSSVPGPSQVPCTCQPGWWALGWAVGEHQLPWAAAERSVGHAVLFSPVVGTRPCLPTLSIASRCASLAYEFTPQYGVRLRCSVSHRLLKGGNCEAEVVYLPSGVVQMPLLIMVLFRHTDGYIQNS